MAVEFWDEEGLPLRVAKAIGLQNGLPKYADRLLE